MQCVSALGSIATIITGVVAAIHVVFLCLEMFLWRKLNLHARLGLDGEITYGEELLAKNMGLYNGFLAAGLAWSVCTRSVELALFFLTCVVVAGIYGWLTVRKPGVFLGGQAAPAVMALIVIAMTR